MVEGAQFPSSLSQGRRPDLALTELAVLTRLARLQPPGHVPPLGDQREPFGNHLIPQRGFFYSF